MMMMVLNICNDGNNCYTDDSGINSNNDDSSSSDTTSNCSGRDKDTLIGGYLFCAKALPFDVSNI